MRELYEKYIFVVETEGEKYAQINGTAVMGGHGGTGAVMRKTATVSAPSQGRPSGVFSADSKAGVTGPSYLKGVSNIEGMLNEIFGSISDLLPHVQMSSEQNYGGIDGDSATSTQFYLVLATLANLPIRQYYAVTGSADQHGMVQAIGGINEKTKGFFDLAKKRGFTGRQGMIFPRANMGDLMLDPEIVQAMAEGKFHMYAVDHVSQGVEMFTGVPYATVIRRAWVRARELRATNWVSRLYWKFRRWRLMGSIVNPAAQSVAPWQPQPLVPGMKNGQEGRP
jgi:predicted ATP-dependent protease